MSLEDQITRLTDVTERLVTVLEKAYERSNTGTFTATHTGTSGSTSTATKESDTPVESVKPAKPKKSAKAKPDAETPAAESTVASVTIENVRAAMRKYQDKFGAKATMDKLTALAKVPVLSQVPVTSYAALVAEFEKAAAPVAAAVDEDEE